MGNNEYCCKTCRWYGWFERDPHYGTCYRTPFRPSTTADYVCRHWEEAR